MTHREIFGGEPDPVSRAVRGVSHGGVMQNTSSPTFDLSTSPADTAASPSPAPSHRTTVVTRSVKARHSTPLLEELDREWARMRRRPHTLRRVRAWASNPVLAAVVDDLRDLDDLVHATQPGAVGGATGDEILRSLISLAASEQLAGRIVLQRILPGLISRARRWDTRGSADVCDIAIGAAWLAIRSYDVDARAHHVAPSLIADAIWVGFRRSSRRKAEQEIPVPGIVLISRPAPPVEAAPLEALAGTLRAARRAGVPAADIELMRRIVVAGSPSQAARDCDVTVRTIRNRRDAASWKIRRALGREWADWTDPLVAA